jgi:pyruvate ferredoxin oxidoreductase alpha subunit
MIISNRTLSAPLSIWNDHSDTMSIRDCGWIQFFVENGQEVYDHVFVSYRLGEDRQVLFPVIVNMDGFILSHVIEPIELIEQEKVTNTCLTNPSSPPSGSSDNDRWDCSAHHLSGDEEGP